MSVTNSSFNSREAEFLETDIVGLNEVYKSIADAMGLENTLIIFNLFHGTQISFPNRLFSTEYTHRAICEEYNGKNVSQLAQKYDYSERSIWRIVKTENIRRTEK